MGAVPAIPTRRLIGLNVQVFDAAKHHMQPLVADARVGLAELDAALAGHRAPDAWLQRLDQRVGTWRGRLPRSPRRPMPNCRRMRR